MYKAYLFCIMIVISFLFILNQNNKVYIKKVYVLYVNYYLDNEKGYQINDNLTYNWELFISSSLEKVNLILFY